jgi:hypothetical protein
MGHSYSSQLKDIVVRLKLDDLDNNGNYHTNLPVRKVVAKSKSKKKHKIHSKHL